MRTSFGIFFLLNQTPNQVRGDSLRWLFHVNRINRANLPAGIAFNTQLGVD